MAELFCPDIQESLAWCQGTPELPGIRRRAYYTSKKNIVKWARLQHYVSGRLVSATLWGSFELSADEKWKYIDFLPEKSQLTSEPQGEAPSQTQLNKLVLVHPGTGEEASNMAAYVNNSDIVMLVQDMRGRWRVVGSELWPSKATVSQDLGQGATGATSTTITLEATDECPAPFYTGTIEGEDGTIQAGPKEDPNVVPSK